MKSRAEQEPVILSEAASRRICTRPGGEVQARRLASLAQGDNWLQDGQALPSGSRTNAAMSRRIGAMEGIAMASAIFTWPMPR